MSKKQKKNGEDTPDVSIDISNETETECENETQKKNEKSKSHSQKDGHEEDNIEKDQDGEDTKPSEDQSNERYIRLLAEYDNYRKRKEREIKEIIETASENLMREFLPVLDNMDRASEHMDNQSIEDYAKGIKLVEEQMRQVLNRAGLEKMEVIGEPFDPAVHEAIMSMESDKYESGVITADVEKGYILNGKIIRHPKVIVSK